MLRQKLKVALDHIIGVAKMQDPNGESEPLEDAIDAAVAAVRIMPKYAGSDDIYNTFEAIGRVHHYKKQRPEKRGPKDLVVQIVHPELGLLAVDPDVLIDKLLWYEFTWVMITYTGSMQFREMTVEFLSEDF